MATTITIEAKPTLGTAAWSKPAAKPGERVEMSVEVTNLDSNRHTVEFEVRGDGANGLLAVIQAAKGKTSADWVVEAAAGAKANMTAVLREAPGPDNGHRTVVKKLAPVDLTVQASKLSISTIDASFVPKQEKLEVAYKIEDQAAAHGRIEVWGERYPTPEPLYTEKFTPTVGTETWKWDGKASAGELKKKYISPEFSPYRVRIVVGADTKHLEDPFGSGAGYVAAIEKSFEIKFQSLHVRLQDGYADKIKDKEYHLEEVLKVEPRQVNGDYAEKGKLPKETEHGRLRVPMARHFIKNEALDQGGNNIGDPYLSGGGSTKQSIDEGIYTRPEIPIEFEFRLKSRDNAVNTDPAKQGLFEKEAVGPVKVEPIAEDFCPASVLAGAGTLDTYLKNAAFKVKKGTHDVPHHDATTNAPEYNFWQARFEVAADGDQDFDVTTFDAAYGFRRNADELFVYLNRTLLERSDRTDDNELDKGHKHYRELPPGGTLSTQIRLGPNLTKVDDVLWVVRIDSVNADVTDWERFPPGTNSHPHYGGFRGEEPTDELSQFFRAKHSAKPPKGREPIIGQAKKSFPYTDWVNMKPDPPDQENQERVECTVVTKGKQQGLAGVIFSPSYIAGDAYVLKGRLEKEAYDRSFGFVQKKEGLSGKSGDLSIWRWIRIDKSIRLPDIGTAGLSPGVGSPAEVGIGARAYHGDGQNMDMAGINAMWADGFCEWTIEKPGSGPVHENADLKKYRKSMNAEAKSDPGYVEMTSNSDVQNEFALYDFYRELLPPGIPPDRRNVASNTIDGLAEGTDSAAVGAAVHAAIGAWELANGGVGAVDAPLDPGVGAIPIYGGSVDNYFMQAFSRWSGYADVVLFKLTPAVNPPKKMNVLRWPELHDSPVWNGYDPINVPNVKTTTMKWQGQCSGSGASIFRSGSVDPTLFAHEMGHSVHLVHFVAMNFGWKHHDLVSPDCFMSYNFTRGFIQIPAGAVGPTPAVGTAAPGGTPWPIAWGGTTVDQGWPHWGTVPNPAPPPPTVVVHGIRYGPNIVPAAPCAKCFLKMRGWKEDVLPSAWLHPDLF